MARHILYSTNVLLKLLMQELFHDDVHYVWCSEYFDNANAPNHSTGKLIAPSSNPATIYKRLKTDVAGMDKNSSKIIEQKASMLARADGDFRNGILTEEQRDEIVYMVDHSEMQHWKPLLYVIPTEPVKDRLDLVPAHRRAGVGLEYIIKDLMRNEFDIVEI